MQSACNFLEDVGTTINNVNMTETLPHTNTCSISSSHCSCVQTAGSGLKLLDCMVLTAEGQRSNCHKLRGPASNSARKGKQSEFSGGLRIEQKVTNVLKKVV